MNASSANTDPPPRTKSSPRYSTAPAATCSSYIATTTHPPSWSSPPVRADQRPPIRMRSPTTSGPSRRVPRPPRPINPNPRRPRTFHPSLLHPHQHHPTGPHRPMAPSRTPPTESRRRSRSMSSSSACASSNSSPPSLNKLIYAKKSGAADRPAPSKFKSKSSS